MFVDRCRGRLQNRLVPCQEVANYFSDGTWKTASFFGSGLTLIMGFCTTVLTYSGQVTKIRQIPNVFLVLITDYEMSNLSATFGWLLLDFLNCHFCESQIYLCTSHLYGHPCLTLVSFAKWFNT